MIPIGAQRGPAVGGLVDVHTHVVPLELPDLEERVPWGRWPSVRMVDDVTAELRLGSATYRTVDDRSWSIEARLRDMEAEGVAVQWLSPIPAILCHEAPAYGARELARAVNDAIGEMVSCAPNRFVGLGSVALQDVDAAIAELERCVLELGFAGVEIGTRVGDRELIDPALTPFFDAVDRLGALVFVHPVDETTDPRLAPMGLTFGVGMPTETGAAAAGLLVSDLLVDRAALTICLAHGGGTLPGILGRIDRGVALGTPGRPRPVELARRLWSDSLTYDVESLELAVTRFGEDHVMFGTDYPFAARETASQRVLDSVAGAWPDDRLDAVGRSNAERLVARIRGGLQTG
ncbi:amidohydrolase family protein [Micromonospora olivasterospora]|uniref:2-amino-3-carboxymuconate-6-semialdehyde decarboxylase n=1 Tax=Micromonospora olivasterospora TaxID=1880 RepID=A0A562I2P6_MICOL|nr:amidohydrolase family protein [Micromonospora olivasterospora]TWH65319.1 aminocarboxymuconate-semialdehyde decarboxylase [Micromonospora olivasterospora]